MPSPPPSIHELYAGRTEILGDRNRAEIPYVVLDAADEAAVLALAQMQVPATHALGSSVLPRRSLTVEERLAPAAWRVVAVYETLTSTVVPPSATEPTVTFDTTGGTQHITQSIATTARYGPDASAQLGGAIGVDGETVQGVDITVPVYQFTETIAKSPAAVDAAYRRLLAERTGTVNADAFRDFAPGEVLFLGAAGQRRGRASDDPWELTYRFAAQPNRTGLSVGSIGGITKRGWDYLWVQYAPDLDTTAQVLIRRPVAVYVEQVYPQSDFADLELPS